MTVHNMESESCSHPWSRITFNTSSPRQSGLFAQLLLMGRSNRNTCEFI